MHSDAKPKIVAVDSTTAVAPFAEILMRDTTISRPSRASMDAAIFDLSTVSMEFDRDVAICELNAEDDDVMIEYKEERLLKVKIILQILCRARMNEH
ncbi:hypothetical protein Plhal304r1_c035g0110041 [Plasmopara halstedii]